MAATSLDLPFTGWASTSKNLLCPQGMLFFHGEKEPPPLETNMVIAVGNCGLYTGPWGVRVEDTVVVGPNGPILLTEYPRSLEK
jgi:Xaa-Pro aminopeptidase